MSDKQHAPDDAPNDLSIRQARVEEVQFDDDTLIAVVLEGEGVAVPVRLICEALGLSVQTQSTRLQEHEVLSRGLRVVRAPFGERLRPVIAILDTYIAYWLATITPGLVKPEVRPKLVRYQTELVSLLNQLYGRDQESLLAAPSPTTDPGLAMLTRRVSEAIAELRLAREALLAARSDEDERLITLDTKVGDLTGKVDIMQGMMDDLQERLAHNPISPAEAEQISRCIKRLATRYEKRTGHAIFGRLFGEFCHDLGTTKYATLPARKYPDALAWLQRKAAELLPDDPDALPPLQERLL